MLRDLPLTSLDLFMCTNLEGMMHINLYVVTCAASGPRAKNLPGNTLNLNEGESSITSQHHTPHAIAIYMHTCVGDIPPPIFVLMMEGKANLKDCGTITMPSADAMAQASPDIINRFQAIKEVNFSGMSNLAGELRGPKAACALRHQPNQSAFLPPSHCQATSRR